MLISNSLLKWKELAKSKSELGDKINTARNAIMKHDLGQKTSQASFFKGFEPITARLDELQVATAGRKTPVSRRRLPKARVPDYDLDVEDEVDDILIIYLRIAPAFCDNNKNNFFLRRLHMKNR